MLNNSLEKSLWERKYFITMGYVNSCRIIHSVIKYEPNLHTCLYQFPIAGEKSVY